MQLSLDDQVLLNTTGKSYAFTVKKNSMHCSLAIESGSEDYHTSLSDNFLGNFLRGISFRRKNHCTTANLSCRFFFAKRRYYIKYY